MPHFVVPAERVNFDLVPAARSAVARLGACVKSHACWLLTLGRATFPPLSRGAKLHTCQFFVWFWPNKGVQSKVLRLVEVHSLSIEVFTNGVLWLRHKAFIAWAKEVGTRPAPSNPLAKKKRKPGQADSQQALVAAIRWALGIACIIAYREKRGEKTTPFGVELVRNLVIYRAAQTDQKYRELSLPLGGA